MRGEAIPRLSVPAGEVGRWAWYDDGALVRRELPREVYLDRFDGEYRVRKLVNGRWRLARGLGRVGPLTRDRRALGEPISVQLQMEPKNDEQRRVCLSLAKQLHSKDYDGFVVDAVTAFGKTYLGCVAISILQRHTLVVVHNQVLLKQWADELQKFLNIPASRIGIWQGTREDWRDKDVVLAMIQTLARRSKAPKGYARIPGLVIFDEVHKVGADKFSKAASLLPARWRIGLSATARRDGRDPLIQAHLGPVLVRAFPLLKRPPRILRATSGWWCPDGLPQEVGDTGVILKCMVANAERNGVVLSWLEQCYAKGRYTFVFSDRKVQLEWLYDYCGVPAKDKALFYGGLKAKDYEHAKTAKVLFTTYGFGGTGHNFPRFDAAIFATPVAHVVQAVGRIMRRHPEKKRPLVIDLIDQNSRVLSVYANARLKEFREMGADVVESEQ